MQTENAEKVEKWSIGIVAALIAALVLAVLVLCAVPPVDRDALTHHLAVPKLYLKYGGMVEIPWVPFSYFPMNLDLIYLIPLYFGNDIIPKYIHFAFGLFTAGLIFSYLRRRTEKPLLGLLGALLFLSLPVIIKLSTTVYVDLGLIYFSTASLMQLFKWAFKDFAWRHLIWAGVFCGLALGTKYNGLIAFFLLTCFVPVVYLRGADAWPTSTLKEDASLKRYEASCLQAAMKAMGYGALFASVALMVFLPWMIRNYVWTRNPVYPLYESVFNATDRKPVMAEADAQNGEPETVQSGMNHLVMRRLVFQESPLETLTIPLRIFFQGEDDNPKLFDGRLNPYLLFLPILAFIGFRRLPRKSQHESIVLAAFSALYLLFAFVQTDMRIRYVAPIIPPLAILSVLGAHNLVRIIQSKASTPIVAIGLVGGLIGLLLIPNFQYTLDQLHKADPFSYLSGAISRDDYIQRFRPEYATYRYINEHLPEKARVLGVFLGNRRYYCERDLICDGTLEAAVRTADSAGTLARIVRAKGFSHIMIRADLFGHSILGRLPVDRVNLFRTFISRYTKQLFSKDGYFLLECDS